jgi:hypothetical protein
MDRLRSFASLRMTSGRRRAQKVRVLPARNQGYRTLRERYGSAEILRFAQDDKREETGAEGTGFAG